MRQAIVKVIHSALLIHNTVFTSCTLHCCCLLGKVDKMVGGRAQAGEKREMTIAEARPLIEAQEEERLINSDTVSLPHRPF